MEKQLTKPFLRTDHSLIEVVAWRKRQAIKKSARVQDAKARQRWKNEVQILSLLGARDNITEIFEYNEGNLSILMRYERGMVLSDCVHDGSGMSCLKLEEADDIWLHMSRALKYLHTHDIIHDDVKPENIMWDRDSRKAVLVDFGAAVHHAAKKTFPFTPSGTPPYAAPEFIKKEKGPKSDIWALGVTILFARKFIKLPDGDWLLPNVFTDPNTLREMLTWLDVIDHYRQQLVGEDPILGQLLDPVVASRIDSHNLVEELERKISN